MRRTLAVMVTLLAAGTVAGSVPSSGDTGAGRTGVVARHRAQQATVWTTTGDRSQLLAKAGVETAGVGSAPSTDWWITVDPGERMQRIRGFGAAMTHSSAYVLSRLDRRARHAALESLFGQRGAGLDLVRLPIGASDFALSHFTYADAPDPSLASFSIRPDREHLLPVLREIQDVNPRVRFLASPWSPPAWMKDSGVLDHGSLLPEHYDTYARYLVRYLRAYIRAGVRIDWISVQNEPLNEPWTYPGALMEADDEQRFIAEHLAPRLRAAGLRTKVLVYDHNWDNAVYPLTVLADERVRRVAAGSAFHCYAGDPAVGSLMHAVYPDEEVWFTECTGGSWAPDFSGNLMWNSRTLVVGALSHWSSSLLLWNLALDENGEPHTGGCDGCRGVLTVRSGSHDVVREVEWYVLAHLGKAVHAGARRVGAAGAGSDNAVAFENHDGSVAVVLYNDSSTARAAAVDVGDRRTSITLPARSLVTLRMPEAGGRYRP